MQTTHSTKLLVSIFVLVLGSLTLPFTHWGCMYNDEFSYLSVGQNTHSVSELKNFFIEGDVRAAFAETKNRTSWHHLDIFYRPLCCIYATVQNWIFGFNVYGYHVSNMVVHGLNTALIYTLISTHTPPITALLGALYFGFHPIIAGDMHHIDYFHIFMSLLLMLICAWCLQRFLMTEKKWFYCWALCAYGLALLTRETALGLIPVIFMGIFLYTKNWRSPFKLTLPFALIALGYIALRFTLYPQSCGAVTSTLFECIRNRFTLRLLTMIYDALGLPWLLYTSSLIRLSVLALCGSFIAYLFIKNRHKLWLVWFACGALALLWPCFTVAGYTQRYLYESLPCIIFFFVTLSTTFRPKYLVVVCVSIIITYNAFCCIKAFHTYEQTSARIAQAVQCLVADPRLTGRTLCFIGRPNNALFGNHIFLRIIDLYRKDTGSVFEDFETVKNITFEALQSNPLIITWNPQGECFEIQ